MKKLVLSLIAVLCLSSVGGATQFGVRLGGLLDLNGNPLPSIGVQYVANDLLGPYTDVRVIAGVGFIGSTVIQIQPSVMFRFPLDDAGNLYAYVGPGVNAFILIPGGFALGIGARGGVEYQFTPNLSVFGDVGGGYMFIGGTFPYFDFAIGLNFRLIESAG